MSPLLRISRALFRRLAGAYPHEFRMRYGADLDRLGEDAVPEVCRRHGVAGVARLLADIALRLPALYLLEIRQDVAYAVRMLGKSPGFTAVAILSLAIGTGMCCATFSEMQAIVRPPAGVTSPAELVTFHWSLASYPDFERYRDQRQAFSSAAAVLGPVPFAVAFTGDKGARAERFFGHLVSPEYFSTLGVTPASGRFFDASTEKLGMFPVVVVSDRFWRAQLGADPHAVGRTVRLNGRPATIVGIGPEGFLGVWPGLPADLFVPVTCGVALAPELSGGVLDRGDREMFRVVFRPVPGVSVPKAEAALNAVACDLDRERGIQRDRGRKLRLIPAGTTLYITPEQHRFTDTFVIVLWTLVAALMCANLANLLLARGSERKREVAVRLSVGASRARLVRQFLTESLLLSLAGGLAGIVLAWWMTYGLSSLQLPSAVPQEVHMQPDLRVLALTLAIALATGIAFGLAPALSSARVDIGLTLKEGAQAPVRGYRRFGVRNLFVVGQMAASLTLVLVTWYVATGFLNTARLDTGFATAGLSLLSLDPVRDGHSAADTSAIFAGLQEELSGIDGVRAVTLTGRVPLASLGAEAPNTRVSYGQISSAVFRNRVGANYFATLGVPLVAGREFDARDQRLDDAEPQSIALPAILNQTAARQLFGSDDPLGARIREGGQNYTVVGIARDVQAGFLITKPVATLFVPLTPAWFRQNPAESVTIVMRGTSGRATAAAVRNQLASLHPDLTLLNMRTMREDLGRLNSLVEWQAVIFIVLGLFALLLACVGLGGVTAYAVVRRRKEIGIRMALGARHRQVQALVLKEGTILVAAGGLLGLCGAFALARAFAAYSDMLARTFGRHPVNSLLVAGVSLLLAGLALAACYLPARQATAIDPVAALRQE